MNTGLHFAAALSASVAFALSSCTPAGTGGRPGPFANGGAASAASDITRAANANGGERYATGSNTATTGAAVTFILAKHQASERQRALAVQRARAAQAKIAAQPAHPAKPGQKPVKKKLPRYLAVETVKEASSVSQAKKAVMIWDTEAQQIVGNNVYDISTPPPVGTSSRFETYAAEYVGAGL